MGAVEILGVAASISLLAGWRLYLCVFAVGLTMRSGWLALPDQLASLDILANPWVIGIAGAGAVAELLADKVALIDTLWDSVHTLIRPVGGALLTLAIVDPADPAWQVAAFLLGGGGSLAMHAAKASARVVVNASPEPFSNILVSLSEDVIAAGILLLILAYPRTAAVVAILLLALAIWAIVALRRLARRMLRKAPTA
jgi:hypothetical protein